MFRAVVAGTVDAGPGDIDFYARQAQYGVHTLSDGELWKELPQYANQAIFASERAIADKRDTLVRALAAYARLYRFTAMANSRDVWIKARAIAMGKDSPEEAEAQWRFFQSPGRLATNLILDPQKIDYVQTLNLKLGVQNRMLPLSQVADMSLARDALKLLS